MLKCARQRGVGRRVAGSVILCRCLVTTPACWLPARVSIHHTCHVSRGQLSTGTVSAVSRSPGFSRSIIPSPAGEQQTPRLFKDWVSVSAGTQITNCSSHTFLRPRPGWRQLVLRTSIFHLTQRSLILGSAMSSIAGLHSCISLHP